MCACMRPWARASLPVVHLQSKMEDHLDEAIHVLRSHAVGTAGDVHSLLPSHGALASSFASPMPVGGRHTGLVSVGAEGAGGWATPGSATSQPPPLLPQVGSSHPEDGLSGGAGLLHSHAAIPSQPGTLPDLTRPPESYSGESHAASFRPHGACMLGATAGETEAQEHSRAGRASSPGELRRGTVTVFPFGGASDTDGSVRGASRQQAWRSPLELPGLCLCAHPLHDVAPCAGTEWALGSERGRGWAWPCLVIPTHCKAEARVPGLSQPGHLSD